MGYKNDVEFKRINSNGPTCAKAITFFYTITKMTTNWIIRFIGKSF